MTLWMKLPLNSTLHNNPRHLNRVLRTSYQLIDNRNHSSSSSSRLRQNTPPQQRLCFSPTRSMTTARMMTSTSTATPNSCSYVFDPPPVLSLPIVGTTAKFPVRRVYCVGKNYVEHVIEMGGNVKRNKPVFFTKPNVDGVVYAGPNSNSNSTPIEYPPDTNNLHYEVELVVAIGKEGHNIQYSNDAALLCEYVYGYAVGIDLTRRDLQDEAKSKRWPWDTAKYFDQSAPIGPITPFVVDDDNDDSRTTIITDTDDHNIIPSFEKHLMNLTVNGRLKQSVLLDEMIWKVPEIISELSKSFTLKPGDLIMTGTPAGVGPVVVGDRIIGSIDGLVEDVDITLV